MILVCAATAVEARACHLGLAHASALDRFEVLRTGMGPAAAAHALQLRLASPTRPLPEAIISSGFAGAKDAGLAWGDWVIAAELSEADATPITASGRLNERLTQAIPARGVRCRSLSAVDPRDAADDGAPSLKRGALPSVVDMESFQLARVASEAGIPFACLRVISDTTDLPIPQGIALLAQIGMDTPPLRQLAKAGLCVLRAPREALRFTLRSSSLPGRLRDGWGRVASACSLTPPLGVS